MNTNNGCHPERSEGSRNFQLARFFALLRMTIESPVCIIAALTLLFAFSSACAGAPTPTPPPTSTPALPTATPVPPTATPAPPTATPTPVTLKQIADQITGKVGKVMKVVEGDPKRAVIVFEETHISRLGQIGIATMLNRLYEKYGVKRIGLEGYFPEKGPLRTAWAQPQTPFRSGQKVTPREDVIAYTLKAGEISSAEFMGLIYADIVVHGIDDAKLYVVPPPGEFQTLATYLLNIAYTRANAQQRAAFQALRDQQKHAEAESNLINTDKFTADTFVRVADFANPLAIEEVLNLLDRIEQEAQKAGFKPSTTLQSNFAALRGLYKEAAQRSDSMVANTIKLIETHPGTPIPIMIGAGHTQGMVELFAKRGIPLAVIRPRSLAEGSRADWLSSEAYQRKQKGQSVAPSGHLGALLEGRIKPPPVVDQKAYQQQAYVKEIADWFAGMAAVDWKNGHSIDVIHDALNEFANSYDFGMTRLRMGIEHIDIKKVEVVHDPSAPYGSIDRDRVQVEFDVVFNDGKQIHGTAWVANPQTPYPSLFDDYLNGMRNSMNMDTAPTSPPDKVPPERISSSTSAAWQLVDDEVVVLKLLPDGAKVTEYKNGKKVTETKDTKVTEYKDGQRVTVTKDGTRITEYTTGKNKGTKVTEHKDGRTVIETQGGTKMTEYTEGPNKGTLETEYQGGMKVIRKADNSTVTDLPDGTQITRDRYGNTSILKPDGTLINTDRDGNSFTHYLNGTYVCEFKDGTKVTEQRDGKKVTEYRDGKKVTEYTDGPSKGTKVTEYTAGSMKGTTETEQPDGTTTVTMGDGSKIVSKGGMAVTEYKDRKVTETKDTKVVEGRI